MIVMSTFDEDVIGALINHTKPGGESIGHKLGTFTISQAQDLEHDATRLSEGRLGIKYNDDGQVLIVDDSFSNTAD